MKKRVLLISFLMVFTSANLAPVAHSAIRLCSNAEQALIANLRQQILTISSTLSSEENKMQVLKQQLSERDFTGNSNSPTIVKLKVQIDIINSTVSKLRQKQNSLDNESKSIQKKCKLPTGTSSKSPIKAKNRCMSAEKNAIQSTKDNVESLQINMKNWEGKVKIAQSYAQDFGNPATIRAQATMDITKYVQLIQQEIAKETLAIKQFMLLNESCKSSGISAPSPYDFRIPTSNTPTTDIVNNQAKVVVTELSFDSDANRGGIEVIKNSDGTFSAVCKPSAVYPYNKFDPALDMRDAKLFLVGSLTNYPSLMSNVFTLERKPKKYIIKFETIYSGVGNKGVGVFTGKYINFKSGSNSACDLQTENLADLNKSFATDLVSIGLLLKVMRPSEEYFYLGGAPLL
jgi:hypothetical protein